MKTNLFPTAATLAAGLAAALTLAACNPATESPRASAPSVEDGAAVLADKAMSSVNDAAITAAVNSALAKDDELSALRIDVDTVDGHVVLAGSAPNPDARRRASFIARGVPGVKSVDNRLSLPPVS